MHLRWKKTSTSGKLGQTDTRFSARKDAVSRRGGATATGLSRGNGPIEGAAGRRVSRRAFRIAEGDGPPRVGGSRRTARARTRALQRLLRDGRRLGDGPSRARVGPTLSVRTDSEQRLPPEALVPPCGVAAGEVGGLDRIPRPAARPLWPPRPRPAQRCSTLANHGVRNRGNASSTPGSALPVRIVVDDDAVQEGALV